MNNLVNPARPLMPQSAAAVARIQKAQWYVGGAMSSCLALWFAPIVSGVACSMIEAKLIKETLKLMECYSEAGSEKVLWFFRGKTFFLFGATYVPFAGVPLQLFETYGLGQFAIHCALKPELLTDDAWLEQSWKEVESDIFSGDHAIQSYEQSTGSVFPHHARKKFIFTVNAVNKLYLASQRFPGAAKTQQGLGEMVHGAMKLGKRAATGLYGIVSGKVKKNRAHQSDAGSGTPVRTSTRNPSPQAQEPAMDYMSRVFAAADAEKKAKEANAAVGQTKKQAHEDRGYFHGSV